MLSQVVFQIEELESGWAAGFDLEHVVSDEWMGFGALRVVGVGNEAPLADTQGQRRIDSIKKPVEWLASLKYFRLSGEEGKDAGAV